MAAPAGTALANRHGLTDQQRDFVVAYISGGGNATLAARAAGYSESSAHVAAYRLKGLPHIQAAIQEGMREEMRELAAMALGRLRDVLKDPTTKATVIVDAVKMLADRSGLGPQKSDGEREAGSKPIAEMTLAELEALVQRRSASLAVVSSPAIEGAAVQVPDKTGES